MSSSEELGLRTRNRVMRRLLPYLMGIYLLAYVDRANLSVAKLQMQDDLRITDAQFGFGAGIFFLGYMLLEIPGSLIVERWSARKWIARIMISWGILAALCGFWDTALYGRIPVTTQFYGMRFLLGAAEAGFFPGVIVYLSHWFRTEDRTRAKAYFMMTQPLALLVSVPFSRWLMEAMHSRHFAGWRWLLILEGLPSVLMGVVTLFYLKDHPRDAKWLPDDEKQWLIKQLASEREMKSQGQRLGVASLLREPRILLLTIVYLLAVASNQGFVFFFPTLIENYGNVPVHLRTLMSGVPYLFGAAGIYLIGLSAARYREQRLHTAVPILVNAAALALLLVSQNSYPMTVLSYALIGFTLQSYLPAFWTLPTLLLGGSAAAVAVGTINSVGNVGGFAGPYVFGWLRTSSGNFDLSLWVLVGITVLAGLLALALRRRTSRVS